MNNKTINQEKYLLGKQLIESALKIDATLIDLLKLEVKNTRKMINNEFSIEELRKNNMRIKTITFLMIMTDEKIRNGISLCNSYEKNNY